MNLRNLIFLCFLGLISCEKDDICLEGTPGTPRMVVLFRDHENPSARKEVSELTIKGFDQEEAYLVFSGDSVGIPLKNNFELTQYELVLGADTDNPIADSLQINHKQFDIYINRACGYKTNYIFKNPSHYILTQGNGWIKNIEIIKDTLSDEEDSHLAIYH